MGIISVLLLAIALSVDTFTVSVTIGLCQGNINNFIKQRYFFIIGIFHFFMILVGWSFGSVIHNCITDYDHWIAFVLFSVLGVKMISESFSKNSDDCSIDKYTTLSKAILLGFLLSIDAIIAGFSFSMINLSIVNSSQFINIILTAFIIGLSAYIATWIGFITGKLTVSKIGSKSEILGGIILIFLGVKTLLEHLYS